MTKRSARRPAKHRPSTRRARTRRRASWLAATAGAAVLVMVIVLAVLAGGGGGSVGRGSGGGDSARRPGDPVPTASFATFEGRHASLLDYRGKPLVLNFFASWCVPCLAEMPGFEQVHQRLAGQVNFVGMNLQDAVADGRSVIKRTGITYDTGRDPDGAMFRAFGGFAMPTTVFVDARGTIVEVRSGEITAAELEAKIHGQLLR